MEVLYQLSYNGKCVNDAKITALREAEMLNMTEKILLAEIFFWRIQDLSKKEM